MAMQQIEPNTVHTQPTKIRKPPTNKKPPKQTKPNNKKCGRCGQTGHIQTNKICPMYNKVSERESDETIFMGLDLLVFFLSSISFAWLFIKRIVFHPLVEFLFV